MRRILVERARQRRATKHGGDFDRIDFHEALLVSQEPEHDLLALDEALSKLEKVDPAAVRLVQLRYFAGLQRQEIADILRMSPRSIDRLWAFTKAWLLRELES